MSGPPKTPEYGSHGRSSPLGATVSPRGVNFSVYSRNATGVELLLFDREDDMRPERIIPIDPVTNRTYHYWHVFVEDIRPGQLNAYRADGPFEPAIVNAIRSYQSSSRPICARCRRSKKL